MLRTHLGEWRGHAPKDRGFHSISEVYVFHLDQGKIVQVWGVEDTLRRLEQLGLQ